MSIRDLKLEQKQYVVGVLELACRRLDITDSERTEAEKRYESVGDWLAGSPDPLLSGMQVYTQGSIRLRTVIRPLTRNEFDVDLVCFAPHAALAAPRDLREAVGQRLRDHGVYRDMLEPLNRGWRLTYANEFHMDITPAVDDPHHLGTGLLVPDRELKDWKASDPRGYAKWFEGIASREPKLLLERVAKAEVEQMPGDIPLKGSLRRIIQIAKRHRDKWCLSLSDAEREHAPISIVMTTLAARAFEHINIDSYDNALDLILDVVEAMPRFVESLGVEGVVVSWVPNPTNEAENFADKWIKHPERRDAFYRWHAELYQDISSIQVDGLDSLAQSLKELLDETVARDAMSDLSNRLNEMRKLRTANVARGGSVVTAIGGSTGVPHNTFFGRDD